MTVNAENAMEVEIGQDRAIEYIDLHLVVSSFMFHR